jgi:hypothetical protein
VEGLDQRSRKKRRHETRLGRLRRRVALASTLGFAAFFGLAAQHAVGSSKRRAGAVVTRAGAVAASAPFFDQRDDGFAFADSAASSDPSSPAPAAPQPPQPVAQTSVS